MARLGRGDPSRILSCAVLLLAAIAAAPAAAIDRPVVAVFNIEARRVALSASVLSSLSDYLAAQLAAGGSFSVVPRDRLKRQLTAQKRSSYKQCFSQSCQIEIGQELAAQKSLATQILKLGGKCVVTATIYDLKRAATDRAATAEGGCGEAALAAAMRAVAQRLAGREPASRPAPADPASTTPAPEVGMTYGPVKAPITIEEFTDYQCPFCRVSEESLRAALPKFAGKVRYVHRDYPLDASCNPRVQKTRHPLACRAAYYARCAGVQGKFRPMNAAIFGGQLATEGALRSAARRLGLDLKELERCLSGPRARQAVLADIAIAAARGITATPVLFVNGERIVGARDVAFWEQKLRSLLER